MKIFNFFVLIEFHSIYEPSGWKIDFLTNLSKFYTFVQFFLFLVNISAIF